MKMNRTTIAGKSSFCDRFLARPRAQRRPREAGRSGARVARHQIPLSILCTMLRGGGETPRPSDAPSSFECAKFRSDILVFGPVCCRTPQALFFSQKPIIVGFPIENEPGECRSKSSFCDRFLARRRARRRPREAGRSCARVAQHQIPLTSLRILCAKLRGGGETPRPSDAPSSFECVIFERICCHARILVLFAVELHRRCFFFQKPL